MLESMIFGAAGCVLVLAIRAIFRAATRREPTAQEVADAGREMWRRHGAGPCIACILARRGEETEEPHTCLTRGLNVR